MSILWRIAATLLAPIAAAHPAIPPTAILDALHPDTDSTNSDRVDGEPPPATARGPPRGLTLKSRPYKPAWPGNPNQTC